MKEFDKEMNAVQIGLAVVKDIEQIVSVKQRVWPQEPSRIGYIQSTLTHPQHAVVVAWWNGNLVGFADGFVTCSAAGQRRWEVDLLAVAPEVQGHGLGTRLVAASLVAGERKGARVSRGLVRLDNLASQRVFARCGFLKIPPELALYVSTGSGDLQACEAKNVRLIAVQTFNYRGLWLEESITESTLTAAAYACRSRNLDLTGALIPAADVMAVKTARRLGFSQVGVYQWWAKDLVEREYAANDII